MQSPREESVVSTDAHSNLLNSMVADTGTRRQKGLCKEYELTKKSNASTRGRCLKCV